MRTNRLRDERGAIATEFAVVMGVILLSFFALVIYGGRVVQAENDVQSAAHAGARAATLEGDAGAADGAARAVVATNLAASGVACSGGAAVNVDTDNFAPGGWVTVTVTCNADFSDVSSVGVAPSAGFTARATEVIDVYRGG